MKERPLLGKRILVTRAKNQSRDFSSSLRRLGAEVIEYPTIEIVPPRSWKKADRAIDQLDTYDWVIFTSVNGVDFFFKRLEERGKGPEVFSSLKVCAIGPATSFRLTEKKVIVDYIPKEFIAESILEGFRRRSIKGKRILLARAQKARNLLPKGLESMGAEVEVIEVYRTVKPRGRGEKLKRLLMERKVDLITFTSSSTVSNFVELLKGEELNNLLQGVLIASIGPVTAKTAKSFGLKVHIQSQVYTIPGLIKAITAFFKKRDFNGS
ncbi:MAG: uroporphyrinogen-III synthase [Thermodesulfobacteriota bacterium]